MLLRFHMDGVMLSVTIHGYVTFHCSLSLHRWLATAAPCSSSRHGCLAGRSALTWSFRTQLEPLQPPPPLLQPQHQQRVRDSMPVCSPK